MYTNGVIAEQSYDRLSIPMDKDMNGFTVACNFTISQENRQRAKILSSPTQVQERREVIYAKQMMQYERLVSLYDAETKDYVLNKRCEDKLVDIAVSCCRPMSHADHSSFTVTPLPTDVNLNFKEACNGLTLGMVLSKKSLILLPEARAFIRVRSDSSVVRGKRSFKNIPSLKDDMLD